MPFNSNQFLLEAQVNETLDILVKKNVINANERAALGKGNKPDSPGNPNP